MAVLKWSINKESADTPINRACLIIKAPRAFLVIRCFAPQAFNSIFVAFGRHLANRASEFFIEFQFAKFNARFR